MPLLPLEGFVIGVTADRRSLEQAELLERRGATVLHGPTISTEYLGNEDALREATDAVIARPPDYLVATTGIGVRAWFDASQSWGAAEQLARALSNARIIARGPKAVAALQVAGLEVWASPATERLDDALAVLCLEPLDGRVIAFQHFGECDLRAVADLAQWGAQVVEVPVYRYRPAADEGPARALVEAIVERQVDGVTFTSAPAVRNLLGVSRDMSCDGELLAAFNDGDVVVACVGPVCGEVARSAGVVAPIIPSKGRLGLLVRALSDELQGRRRDLRCGDVTVVVQGRAIVADGHKVTLTPRERVVLEALLRRPGTVVSKAAILRSLRADPGAEHALEATIGRLRRQLGPAGTAISAVRGRGYRLDLEPTA